MATLWDFLSGAERSTIQLHLSTVPLPVPFDVGEAVEASFEGYLPSPATPYTIHTNPGGFGVWIANFSFDNRSGAPVALTGAWLTAEGGPGAQFFAVFVPTVGSSVENLPPGQTRFSVTVTMANLEIGA
jgi:hypothetical protein